MIDDKGLTANAAYLDEQYQAWKQDPSSVSADLSHFFQGFEFALCGAIATQGKELQSSVNRLMFNYRSLGHRIAKINPLGGDPDTHPELELLCFDLSEADLDKSFALAHVPGLNSNKLRDLVQHLRQTYCGAVAIEYMHIQDSAERRWLQERMESTRNTPQLTGEQRIRSLWKLNKAALFEEYLHTTYRGQKRFSLEGAETLIPAMDYLIEKCATNGIVEIVVGMAHRGRLNVLANVVEKSYDDIFSEFEDNYVYDSTYGDSDVKYHKGFSNDILTTSGIKVHISLTANPSHLEAVGPVVEGRVRAKQAAKRDVNRKQVLPFLIHGDAAFAGQGIVAETFNLSQLKGYRTGGTIHFVVNNQVGFTTTAQDYLSGLYCTDVAKMVSVPIFHVNGDRPESVLHVMDMALDYRQTFGKDVVIDMWCYRKYGHNEADEPSFTQPILYERIAKHEPVTQLYAKELAARGDTTEEEARNVALQFKAKLEEARANASRNGQKPKHPEMTHRWAKFQPHYRYEPMETGVDESVLLHIADTLTKSPENFNPHRKIVKMFQDNAATVHARGNIAWPLAELLAFGSLLSEGRSVRLSGEDSRRGTFSQRHAVLYDQKTGEQFIPLLGLGPKQGEFCVYDSSLAEASVLAFDYGYSLDDPDRLILWEAQFGDFSNGAQVIIDQFIAAALSKWRRYSGLVMLLPHGYEGQGPEHSNAWLRRYLSLCAEENMQVCYPSTPAQYFHLLRRQMKRDFRRPLVVMTPKSMLRNPQVHSPLVDFTQGHFQDILDDTREIKNAKRVIFCSGKVYYDLQKKAEELGVNDTPIVRVEQFYPINDAAWDEIAARYASAEEWVWVSEEPTNFGAWAFMQSTMQTYFEGPVWYVGRARSASPATGSKKIHDRQQERIVTFAVQKVALQPELVDGVAVYTRGEELWHMKSKSPRSESPSVKAPSHSG